MPLSEYPLSGRRRRSSKPCARESLSNDISMQDLPLLSNWRITFYLHQARELLRPSSFVMHHLIYSFMACLALVQAHMELGQSSYLSLMKALWTDVAVFPLAIESKYDPKNTNPDYSMTSPLNADGSNFPCKGYLSKADAHVTALFTAGQSTNFTLVSRSVGRVRIIKSDLVDRECNTWRRLLSNIAVL